jgi:hypothetical protein
VSLCKSIFGAVLVIAACAPACAQQFKCPASQGKSPLNNAAVFDGPPAQKADLVPDDSKGDLTYTYARWDVGYLTGSSHHVYLVCKYAGLGDAGSVTVKVDKPVQQCVFRAPKGQPAEAVCK